MRRGENNGSSLGLAEHTCLALVVEGTEHGWAIGTLLAADGDIGRIWSLSRPLTYRAIEQLVDRRLLARRGTAQGRGRQRSLLRATAAGRRVAAAWLDQPVEHLRDVRTELLVKLRLRERAGLANESLLRGQLAHFATTIDSLTDPVDGDLVARWRRESARAVRRFLDSELHPEFHRGAARPPTTLHLSARNQLGGVVEGINHGDVMSVVRVRLPDGQRITSVITNDALGDLDVAVGDAVLVVVKSTEAMLAKG
ncbi:MAG: TOBE domain-containing protein [Acidimicrobiales bacterium]